MIMVTVGFAAIGTIRGGVIEPLQAPWETIARNHDQSIDAISGHRSIEAGPLRLVLLDTSANVFTADDAAWLGADLAAINQPTMFAIHQLSACTHGQAAPLSPN